MQERGKKDGKKFFEPRTGSNNLKDGRIREGGGPAGEIIGDQRLVAEFEIQRPGWRPESKRDQLGKHLGKTKKILL